MLTIAHRLSTVQNYDKILVLSEGKVLEYGPPQDLMQRERSYFKESLQVMNARM